MSRLKKWRLRRAYKLVYKDLRRVSMFRGVYDASNGSEEFMHGVQTVMEMVAFVAEDFNFETVFFDNLTYSQIKAGVIDEQEPRQRV